MRSHAFRAAAALVAGCAALAAGASASPRATADTIGTTFPAGFPVIVDASLDQPVIGFGAAGPLQRTPVIFLHGNNDTPYPTTCNGAFGKIQAFAQYFLDRGYRASELWGLGYQGDQCDLLTNPPNRSGPAHSTLANLPDLRRFVAAVLAYTGASQLDIVGHSLGGTLARTWILADGAQGLVRRLVAVDSPNHGIINCSPNPLNFWQAPALGGFTPDSAICKEYGSDHTPLMHFLNDGDETPGPTRYLVIRNADTSFVYFSEQDGSIPPVPAEDRDGNPHDFSGSARLAGATTVDLVGQGQYDTALLTTHLGIVNSPETWQAALEFLAPPTRVGVHSFGATVTGKGQVTLRWRTGSDSGLAGFHVFRAGGGHLVRRTRILIASKVRAGGSAYVFRDVLAAGGKPARYRLQAVRLDGSRAFVATATPTRR
ncbi:MAG: alpha/beta fold hydrolase [Gaiellaceae bacterium]